ncbi:hypothetical protein V6N13_123170 [Hibiscus sabdariffa]
MVLIVKPSTCVTNLTSKFPINTTRVSNKIAARESSSSLLQPKAMAMKTLMFVCVLVAAMALVAPMAEAQLGGLIGNLLGLIRITGTLFCTVDGNMGVNGTATPVFPNALVQLHCGGSVVSSSTTNGSGIFSILLDPLQVLLSALLNNCNLAVKTPLSNCNASLPSVGGIQKIPSEGASLEKMGVRISNFLTKWASVSYIDPALL